MMKNPRKNAAIVNRSKDGFLPAAKSFAEKYAYVGCAFIIPLLIFWLVYICFEVYPFGNGSVLMLDLNGQYVYFFEALRNAVRGDMSLIYSWSRALGGEFIGIYAYYIASPLSYLVALFPPEHTTEALLMLILLKTGLSGSTMAFYLKKTRPATKEIAVIIFSTMYALSAYAVTYAHNTMWMDAMMLLPLVIYGIEQLVDKHRFALFVVTFTLTLLSNFYIGFMMCFFVLVYFFYYYFTHGMLREHNHYRENLHFLKSLGRMTGASLVSVMMGCLIILPTYYSLTFGKTTFTDAAWSFTQLFDLLDLFTKALPGSYDTVRPEGLPFIYCGVLAILMLPIFFMSKKISARQKVGGGVILAIMIFSMNSMVIDTFLHGMQRPNWLNCRYSFAFIFLVIVFACRAFDGLESVNMPQLVLTGAGIIGLVLVIQKLDYEYLDDYFCIWFTIVCVIAYVAASHFVITAQRKNVALIILASLVCLELFGSSLLSYISLKDDVGMSSRRGYVSYFNKVRGIVESVQDSDNSFYRMEKTYRRSPCDDMALNIRGLACSTSTLNASVIEFLNRMGYASSSHWSEYLGGNMVSDSLLGLKYIITESSTESELLTPYMSDQEHLLYAYLNEYALSMAYSSSNSIKVFDTSLDVSPFEMLNNMVTALTDSDEKVELFKPIEFTLTLDNATVSYDGPVYEKEIVDGEEITISVPYLFYKPKRTTSPGQMTYSFEIPKELDSADVYFFFCSNYPRKVDWEFSGELESGSGTFFGNKSDCIQSLGVLQSGSYDLEITMNEEDNIFYIIKNSPIFYYLDHEVFKEVFSELAEGNWHIDDDYSDTHLKGTVTVPEGDTVMFTSIPYDEGWNVYLDGKKVETYKVCNSLMAFDITEGEHTIEMKYCSKYMVYGLSLFIVGLLLFAGWIVLDRLVLVKKRRAKLEKILLAEAEVNKGSDKAEVDDSSSKQLSAHKNNVQKEDK